MSLAVFFPIRKSPPTIGAIQLDASLSEDHRYENLVTEFPVETGATITDHIVNKPVRLSITGFITNCPIKEFTNVRKEASFDAENSASVYTQVAYDALMALWKDREPVAIVTPLSSYEQMALTSLTIPRNAQVGDALQFTAEFVQILLASAQSESVENLALDKTGAKAGTDPLAKNTKDNGTQTPEEVQNTSFIKNGINRLFGL